MECTICFNEKTKFKLLSCSHFICEKCISDLVFEKVVRQPQSNLKSVGKPNTESLKSETEKNVIECPKCRQDTIIPDNGVAGLKSKFIGKLACRHCDLKKSVEDFRSVFRSQNKIPMCVACFSSWCQTCLMSICSACFIDKHITKLSDGTTSMHSASKWEEYNGIICCLSQMKFQHNKAKMAFNNSREYVEVYTEGLKEYLKNEIEGKCLSLSDKIEEKTQAIAEAYGVNLESITEQKVEIGSIEYLLAEVCNLAGLDKKTAVLDEVVQLMIQEVPYKEIARHVLSPKKIEFEPQWPKIDRFRENCKRGSVIGGSVLKKPSDICLLDNNRLVILDPEVGIFVFQENSPLRGPLNLKYKGRLSRICTFPVKQRPNTVAAIAYDNQVIKIVLIDLEKKGQAEQVSIGGCSIWPVPNNEDMAMASSQSHMFTLSSRGWLRSFGNTTHLFFITAQWNLIHKLDQYLMKLDAVHEKADSTDIFLVNKIWGAIDIITVSNADESVCGIKRVRLPFDPNPTDLFLAPTPEFDLMIIGSVSTNNKLHLWFPNSIGEKFTKLCEFQYVQKMVISNNAAFLILKPKKDSGITSLEMISL